MNTHPYDRLTPELILDAVEAQGLLSDGRLLALNSYENRVYQVGIEDQAPLIAKFYRPERWSPAAIAEEHAFAHALAQHELPIVAPLLFKQRSVFEHQGFHFALYPRRGGHGPDAENPDLLYRLGQLLGRIHNLGATEHFVHRERWDVALVQQALDELATFPALLEAPCDYLSQAQALLDEAGARIAAVNPTYLRVHGDCHIGNLLYRDEQLWLVDLDDTRMAPAIQDIWLLLSPEEDSQRRQLTELIDGYEEFRDFPRAELALIEPLRALRLVHYDAWLAKRWADPAFPRAFPWFAGSGYWQAQARRLQEQRVALTRATVTLY
ncbi:serine/threonine protein kinase [Atopomonas sediminilitoris]|uniref:serine/threonine protein kinase n=1 Tax=Atopomonas sediminilitoris TaxID=2919919 RepID=UPI001F4EEEFB|nr:serine/threonine protein kinase [Atopomonas sediminilitoris]MCJ8170349.1 serine/threonine protein kinase [Atopomonas sediminilitoris]